MKLFNSPRGRSVADYMAIVIRAVTGSSPAFYRCRSAPTAAKTAGPLGRDRDRVVDLFGGQHARKFARA
jgi:hypothetical protein